MTYPTSKWRSKATLILLLFFFTPLMNAQVCVSGAIYVTGAECGCVSGCDLTALGGPNCGGGVSGNCSCKTMSVMINIPSACEVTIQADMMNRSGCNAGQGADGSCDNLRIRNLAGGSPAFQTGDSDAHISDQMILTGPATVIIEGQANRSDEIITYTVTNTGACPSCSVVLPIRLLDFTGESHNNESNLLKWRTGTEINNDYFTLERSVDTVSTHFEKIAIVKGAGNSDVVNEYSIFDNLPEGMEQMTYYYRLSQTDFDGKTETFSPVSIARKAYLKTYFANKKLYINSATPYDLTIMDITGKMLIQQTDVMEEEIDLSYFPKGVYVYSVFVNNETTIQRLVVE